MTTPDASYPEDNPTVENRPVNHDLDPTGGSGDLVVHVNVERLQSLVIAAHSVDSNAFSASVRWIDNETDDNLYVSQSNTDIALDSVTDDWSRLARKGPVAEVTLTSEVSDGTQNRVNAFFGGHR